MATSLPAPHDGPVSICPAVPGDMADIRFIVAQTWADTYGPLVGQGRVATMVDTLLNPQSLSRLIADASTETPLARVCGVAAATALARVEDNCLRVLRLYVLPDFQGRGLGVALLAWLAARQRAGMTIRLEAAVANTGALRFYAREGFVDIGGDREIIGGVTFEVRHLERRAAWGD